MALKVLQHNQSVLLISYAGLFKSSGYNAKTFLTYVLGMNILR